MFGFFKSKGKNADNKKDKKSRKSKKTKDKVQPKTLSKEQMKKMSREELIAHAQHNAQAARDEIGDETLEKIKEAMMKKQNSPLEKAKAKVREMDQQLVADSVSDWMRQKD